MPEQDIGTEGLAFAQKIFDDVGAMTKDPDAGYSRQGYSSLENQVHEYIRGIGRELGLEEKEDAAGNLYLTLPGLHRELPALFSGSHGDSVPQGGNFDGLAGVTAALTVIWWMKRTGYTPYRDFTLLVLRLEESAYFGKSYVGSCALTGRLKPDDLKLKHRTKPETLGDAIRSAGFDPEKLVTGTPLIDLKKIAGFIELHIEQGPTLDSHADKRVGVVTGIRGNLRHKVVRCIGETAHSGAVNREFRHDAVLATADLLMRMEKHWEHRLDREEDLVFTVGVLKTSDSAALTKVPGLTTFCIDMRSLSMGTLERFHEVLLSEAERVGKERGVKFEFDPVLRTESAKLDSRLVAHLANSAAAAGIPYIAMPSGAGHDSAILETAGVPAAMIFVANQKGSHNPNESMKIEDFMQGVKLLWKAVETYDA